MSRTIQKVTALITRQQDDKPPELLVFRHPLAGTQLPAGTVEVGEGLEAALLREVSEETGLSQVRLVRHLDSWSRDLTDVERPVLGKTSLRIGPSAGARALNLNLRRGSPVRVVSRVGAFAEVVWEEYILHTDPPQPRIRVSGWLPADLLALHLERHFYHLTLTTPTPETWSVAADRHLFQLYWTPLKPKPHLVTGQNRWLDFIYERLLESTGHDPG